MFKTSMKLRIILALSKVVDTIFPSKEEKMERNAIKNIKKMFNK